MDPKNLGTIAILFFLSLFASSAAISENKKVEKMLPIEIYSGAISIDKVAGRIQLKDGSAPAVTMNVKMRNDSKAKQDFDIGFRSTDPKKLGLKKSSSSSVELSPVVMHKGQVGKAQMANIDLTLLLDGRLPGNPVSDIDIKIELPANTKKIIRSSRELLLLNEGGKNVYHLQQSNKYLGRLNIVYTTGPVLLDIKKVISPAEIKKGSVEVTLTIKNEGTQTAQNVLIEDNYDPRDFTADGEGFTLYQGEENDSRLIWRKMIPSLAADEIKIIKYKVKAQYDVNSTKLTAATASINKELVGVSNKIRLSK